MNKVHVKKGDTVIVLSGEANKHKCKGTIGEVLEVSPEEGKVIVKGANLLKKHVKPRKQGEQGGIITVEGAMYASKVALYCPDCQKGVRYHTIIEMVDGKDGTQKKRKIRVCSGKKSDGTPCGHKFD